MARCRGCMPYRIMPVSADGCACALLHAFEQCSTTGCCVPTLSMSVSILRIWSPWSRSAACVEDWISFICSTACRKARHMSIKMPVRAHRVHDAGHSLPMKVPAAAEHATGLTAHLQTPLGRGSGLLVGLHCMLHQLLVVHLVV
jgi:hypothetical protein